MECVKDGIYNKLDFYEAIIIVNDLYNIILRKLVINKTFHKKIWTKQNHDWMHLCNFDYHVYAYIFKKQLKKGLMLKVDEVDFSNTTLISTLKIIV
jgi:hypothetical protein